MIKMNQTENKSCIWSRIKNTSLLKVVAVLIATFVFSLSSAATAFAQVNDTNTASTDNTSSTSVTATTEDNQELVLEDGYYIGEDGQIYYDESKVTVEETVIEENTDAEDITEEDSEEDSEEQVQEDSSSSKNNTKKDTQKTEKKVSKPSYSEEDLRLLSSLIYAEAGNQSYKGMLAVANVVLNRAGSKVFWHTKTVKDVIYDHKWAIQFSVTIKSSKTGLSPLDKALKSYDTGKFTGANQETQKKAMDRATKAAKAALEGTNNIGNYLCFTNKRAASSIKNQFSDYKILGDHIFYRNK